MRISLCIITLIFLLLSNAAAAEERFDGTKTLLCASIEAIDCVSGQPCVKDLPEIIGAPQFMKVDFDRKEIAGPKRTTPIVNMKKDDAQILLQGTELNMGWVFVLDRITGKFSTTLAGGGGVFVFFGACTPLQELRQ
jgi:hypothetical protein